MLNNIFCTINIKIPNFVMFRKVMTNLNNKTIYILSEIRGLLQLLQKELPNTYFEEIRSPEKCENFDNLNQKEIELVKNAEILIAESKIISDILYDVPKMNWIQSTWAGVETVFKKLDPNKPHPNFILTRLGNEKFADYMAEYVIAQIIINERQIFEMWDNQKHSKWVHPSEEKGRLLENLSVGIFGVGDIGKRIAKFLKQRGATVYGYARHSRSAEELGDFSRIDTELTYMLENCDYLCNVLPSTSETKGLLNGTLLKKCLKKPVFINLGRGDIIKEVDLIISLKEQWISKAILDVFETEPLSSDSILWKLPNVIITPHIGSTTQTYQVVQCFVENYNRLLSGNTLLHTVNWKAGY